MRRLSIRGQLLRQAMLVVVAIFVLAPVWILVLMATDGSLTGYPDGFHLLPVNPIVRYKAAVDENMAPVAEVPPVAEAPPAAPAAPPPELPPPPGGIASVSERAHEAVRMADASSTRREVNFDMNPSGRAWFRREATRDGAFTCRLFSKGPFTRPGRAPRPGASRSSG